MEVNALLMLDFTARSSHSLQSAQDKAKPLGRHTKSSCRFACSTSNFTTRALDLATPQHTVALQTIAHFRKDKPIMHFSRKYCPGPDLVEDPDCYQVGGLHPVLIGDRFRDDRYMVLHKLGYGGFSTVWLARDHAKERYVALKVLSAAGSKDNNEVVIQRYLSKLEDVSDDLHITKIIDSFTFRGPNGRHTCLVLELAGPSLNILCQQGLKVRPDSARSIARQIAGVVGKFHANDVVVGDLTPGNILLNLKNIDSWSEANIYQRFEQPETYEICPANEDDVLPPNAPKYQYDHIQFGRCDMRVLEPKIKIADLNEAVYTGTDPSLQHDVQSSAANTIYAAPEWLFGINKKHTKASDIFALACILWEVRTSYQLIPPPLMGDCTDGVQRLLGEIPPEWKAFQQTEDEDNRLWLLSEEECGSDSLESKLEGFGTWEPWHYMTPEQRKQHFFSDAYTEEQRNDDGFGFDIENDLSTIPPPAKPSDEELHDLKDLLSKMLTYLPSERITIDEVLQHPWLNKQYKDLDDPSAPWICRYDGGCKYFMASLWYKESVLGEELDEGEQLAFEGRERKYHNEDELEDYDEDEEDPPQNEDDTFYDCLEEIYYDTIEYHNLDSGALELEKPEHEDKISASHEAMPHPVEEGFSVTRLLGLPQNAVER